MRKFLLMIFIANAMISKAQSYAVPTVFEDWRTTAGTQNFFFKGSTISDASGNVYVCGATLNQYGNYDILVSKYNNAGTTLWTYQYNGNGNGLDGGASIALDYKKDVYVCGTTYESSADSNNCILMKFNGVSGGLSWTRQYNGGDSRNDGFADISIYRNKICVTGSSWSNANLYDVITQCYDSTGNNLWTSRYDFNNKFDGGVRVRYYAAQSYFIIAGGGQTSSTNFDYIVLAYKAGTGILARHASQSGSVNGFDEITDAVSDAAGNIYVTGGAVNATAYDYLTVKLDSTLSTIWSATYTSAGTNDDKAKSIVVDDNGGVYVTGYTTKTGSGSDYMTIKYSPSGIEQWRDSFNGPGNAGDSAKALVLDMNQKNIYVSGSSFNGTSFDYHTIKYDTAGTKIWDIDFNSFQNGNDLVKDMAIDTAGGIVVIGQTQLPGILNYNTVRYIEKDVITPPDTVKISSSFNFEQNRGQLINSDSLPQNNIRFYAKSSTPGVFFADTSVSYVWVHADSSDAVNDSLARVDMKFANSNSSKALPLELRKNYNNYFTGYAGNRPKVPIYNRVMYPEVYSKIDVMFSSNNRGLKHYFIMKPGSNPSNIKLKFNGADSVKSDNDTLKIFTKLGVLKQWRATAFSIDNSGNHVSLSWHPHYTVTTNDTVKFTSLGSYNSSYTLVFACDWGNPVVNPSSIDNLEWSNYVGSYSVWDFYTGVKTDKQGDVCAVGYVWGPGFPTAPFVVQPNYAGGTNSDQIISFYDSSYTMKWSTYYGGADDDVASGTAFDLHGNILVTGATKSLNFFTVDPQTTGEYYQSTQSGSYDATIVKIDTTGQNVFWSTYYGGTNEDFSNSIITDAIGNIYIAGGAQSDSTSFPLKHRTGAYYNDSLNLAHDTCSCTNNYLHCHDAFISMFDTNYNLLWATYYGGSKNDEGKSIAIAKDGKIYLSGNTISKNFPLKNLVGAYNQGVLNGGANSSACPPLYDIFLVRFGSGGQREWATYYGGGSDDFSHEIIADLNSNIFLAGNTKSSNFPTYYPGGSAYCDSTYGGVRDAVILKFDATGARKWGTYFGATQDDGANAITADTLGNIYVAGFLSVGVPLVTPSGAFSQFYTLNQNGQDDAFIASFIPSLRNTWTTYFGGSGEESVLGLNVFKNKLYMVGSTASDNTILWNAAIPLVDPCNGNGPCYLQDYFAGGLADAFISRFDLSPIFATGINEYYSHNSYLNLSVFPNPTDDNITLLATLSDFEDAEITVYDLLGKVIYNEKLIHAKEIIKTIYLTGFSEGIYFATVKTNKELRSAKFIKTSKR